MNKASDVFALNQEEDSEVKGQLAFLESVKSTPPRANDVQEEPGRLRSLASSIIKGPIQGIVDVGRAFGPLQPRDEEEAKFFQQFPEQLSEALPTQDRFLENVLERGGRIGATLEAFPVASVSALEKLIRSGIAATSAETVKEFGGGEVAQAIAEVPALVGPKLTSKLIPKTKQEAKFIELGEKFGLSAEELTPAMQSQGLKTSVLAKAATKEGRAQDAVKKTKVALDSILDHFKTSSEAAKEISAVDRATLRKEMLTSLGDMPAEVRKVIENDLNDFIVGQGTVGDAVNLFRDINHNMSKGHTKLVTLKDPLKIAISKTAPELGRDFLTANELYGNFANLSNKLKPGKFEQLFSGVRKLRIVGGFMYGMFPMMAEAIGESAVKGLSTEMLVNPRFQNISRKFTQAVNANKSELAHQLWQQYVSEIEKTDSSAAEKLSEIDFQEIFKNQ